MELHPPTVFFRDDDVFALTDPLRVLVELFLDLRVPCNYQVIPTLLDDAAADWLRARHAEGPELLRFNQHGFAHRRSVPDAGRFGEFGLGRPFDEQRADIRAGRALLHRRLGDAFSPDVFSPPWHRYDEATLRALAVEGVTILTARLRTRPVARAFQRVGRLLGALEIRGHLVSHHGRRLPRSSLLELSPAIDVDEDFDRRGRRTLKSADTLRATVHALGRRQRIVGINLHHPRHDGERRQVPGILRRLVEGLRRDGCVFRSIEDLAAELRTAPNRSPTGS